MPVKYEGRTIDLEKGIAPRIARLREDAGLSYQQLADRMKALGCEINPSGIQKTEKSGRRITVDELMGYARAFDMSPTELMGEEQPASFQELWRTYLGVERLKHVSTLVQGQYLDALPDVVAAAKESPELLQAIRDRHDKTLAIQTAKAKRDAESDGDDVSTLPKLEAYLQHWGVYDLAAIAAPMDIINEVDNG